MPKGEDVTTRFRVDISELKKGISEANRQIRSANAEFKAASSGMEDWQSSADGLEAKVRQMSKVLAAEESKLAGYRAQLDAVKGAAEENARRAEDLAKAHAEASAEFGEGSEEARRLQRALKDVLKEQASNEAQAESLAATVANQTARVNRASSELGKYETSLKESQTATSRLSSEMDAQQSELSRLKSAYADAVIAQGKDSDAARALKGDIESLSSELAKNRKRMSDAQSAADGLDRSLDGAGAAAEEADSGFTLLRGSMAVLSGTLLSAAAGAISNLGSQLLGLAESTREYREDIGKLDTAFEASGKTADVARGVYKDLFAVIGEEDRTVETAGHLAKLCTTQEDLSAWTTICTGVLGTFGDSLPVESLTEAANETAKTGQVTGALADALNWAGVSEGDFQASLDACSTEQERQSLITETLSGLYSDAAGKYRENNESVMEARRASSDYADTLADLGEKMEPVATALTSGMDTIAGKAAELVESADMSGIVSGIEAAADAIGGFMTWVVDNKDAVVAGLTAIVAGIAGFAAASMVQTAVTAFQGLITAIKGATTAQQVLNVVMAGNPIGVIVGLISALVAAFVYLWNTSDQFRAFWIGLWEQVKAAAQDVANAIVTFFTVDVPNGFNQFTAFLQGLPGTVGAFFSDLLARALQWGSGMVAQAQQAGSGFVEGVRGFVANLPSTVLGFLDQALGEVASWGGSLMAKGGDAINMLIDGVKSAAAGIGSAVASIGSDIVWGVWNGIQGAAAQFASNVQGFFSGIVDGAKSALGINSPSKVMAREVGRWIPEGTIDGMRSRFGALKAVAAEMGDVVAGTSAPRAKSAAREGGAGGNVYNFYQTNNSPKALSRREIYRQTRRQLRAAGAW